jgi:hypothetical protein
MITQLSIFWLLVIGNLVILKLPTLPDHTKNLKTTIEILTRILALSMPLILI